MARLITEITTTTSHNSSFVAVVGCGGGGGYIIIAPRSTCHLLLGLDCWQIFLRVGRWSYLLSAITIVLKIISSPSSWSRRCWLLSRARNETSRRLQRRLLVGAFLSAASAAVVLGCLNQQVCAVSPKNMHSHGFRVWTASHTLRRCECDGWL